MTLQHVGHVSSEGGPLLVLDVAALGRWGGSDHGDFERVGDWLDRHPGVPGYEADVGATTGLVWDLGGAGTADVFRAGPDRLLLVRAWVSGAGDDEAEVAAAAERPYAAGDGGPSGPSGPSGPTGLIGGLTVTSGRVAVFWPVDRGEEIEVPATTADGDPLALPSIDGAGLVADLPTGRYVAWSDEVGSDDGWEARRCWLLPDGTEPA